MLSRLNIKNVALINEAEIEFSKGLNVLSGETGAGKSVILDSINFVLGAKADKSLIRHGKDFCLVSCTFKNYSQEVADVLGEFGIEVDEDLIIKRRYDLKGNGYIKINGETVTASMLKKITTHLVDVHGQSEHFLLLGKSKQLECIDREANLEVEKASLKTILTQIKECESQITALGGTPQERAVRLDILKYQINEIELAELKDGEEEELDSLKNKLLNLEKIYSALGSVCNSISDDGGAIDGIGFAMQSLKPIVALGGEYDKIFSDLSACAEELTAIGERARDMLDNLDGENVDIDSVEQRLEIYKNIKKKYGADLSAVNFFLEKAKNEFDQLSNFDEKYEELQKELLDLKKSAYSQCETLSSKRKKYAVDFSVRVTDKLRQLGMPGARFEVEFLNLKPFNEVSIFSYNGLDEVEFYFSANAGEPLKPLSKIISGGEMSRFMLAIKTQAQTSCGTYIFDEIDAGLSGVVAGIVAKNFAEISLTKQVIAISHLPQIAAMSDNSIFIEKVEECEKTFTKVRVLENNEKVYEIVRLIGGEVSDITAKNHAKHLIDEAVAYKSEYKNAKKQ